MVFIFIALITELEVVVAEVVAGLVVVAEVVIGMVVVAAGVEDRHFSLEQHQAGLPFRDDIWFSAICFLTSVVCYYSISIANIIAIGIPVLCTHLLNFKLSLSST